MRKSKFIQNVKENRRNVSSAGRRDMGAILLFIFLLPFLVSFFWGRMSGREVSAEVWNGNEWEETQLLICSRTMAGVEIFPLESYLVYRLPATIPMEYEMEALKAQAVVLRTDLMRRYQQREAEDGRSEDREAENWGAEDGEAENRRSENGEGGSVLLLEEQLEARYGIPCLLVEEQLGESGEDVYEKSRKAVEETRGIYLTYEGRAALAPFFAVSAGATRQAEEVPGLETYPYLQTVICDRDFTSSVYTKNTVIRREDFFQWLHSVCPEGVSKEKALQEILEIHRDSRGYVTRIGANGKWTGGENFRWFFDLPSACFEIEERGDEVWIKTRGAGHGLGMSQYAANEEAKKGSDFIALLQYFFAGLSMEK